LFVNGSSDLNTLGLNTVGMKAFAPGMLPQTWAYPNVTVSSVPEPPSPFLFSGAAVALMCNARFRQPKRIA
jgi:hypothetical protein